MADPFHSPPSPKTPRVTRVALVHSPLTQHGRLSVSPHSTPSTPMPSQPYGGDFMRQPISQAEYRKREPLRNDRIFNPYRAVIREARTVVSCEWKAKKCQGKFEAAP